MGGGVPGNWDFCMLGNRLYEWRWRSGGWCGVVLIRDVSMGGSAGKGELAL